MGMGNLYGEPKGWRRHLLSLSQPYPGRFCLYPLSCITSWKNAGSYPQLQMKELGSG